MEILVHENRGLGNLPNESWLTVKDYEGYFISNYGRLKSFRKSKYYLNNLEGTILYQGISKKGYCIIYMSNKDQKSKGFAAHRIVAAHFKENPLGLEQVNHIDGNKKNNHSSNLEWVSCKENIQHAIRSGLRTANMNLGRAMFDKNKISHIRSLINQGSGNKDIAKIYNCAHSTISKIRCGVHYSLKTA